MKTILFYFLLAILAVSCQSKQSENTEKEVSDNVSNSDTEECIAHNKRHRYLLDR